MHHLCKWSCSSGMTTTTVVSTPIKSPRKKKSNSQGAIMSANVCLPRYGWVDAATATFPCTFVSCAADFRLADKNGGALIYIFGHRFGWLCSKTPLSNKHGLRNQILFYESCCSKKQNFPTSPTPYHANQFRSRQNETDVSLEANNNNADDDNANIAHQTLGG